MHEIAKYFLKKTIHLNRLLVIVYWFSRQIFDIFNGQFSGKIEIHRKCIECFHNKIRLQRIKSKEIVLMESVNTVWYRIISKCTIEEAHLLHVKKVQLIFMMYCLCSLSIKGHLCTLTNMLDILIKHCTTVLRYMKCALLLQTLIFSPFNN